MINKIKELYLKYREIVDYLFWGVMTTVVSWGSYTVFSLLFSLILNDRIISLGIVEFSLNVTISNTLSWICAVLFAFITNKLWVFRSKSFKKEVVMPEFTKFVGTRLATGILEMIAVPLAVALGMNQSLFGIEGMLAKVIISLIVVLLNYVFSKLFIFKSKK